LKELEIFLFSIFSSTIAPILGIGGGTFNVPFLTLYIGVEFPTAVTASLLAGACMSFSASLFNMKKMKTDAAACARLLPAILLGSAISAYIPIKSRWLFLLFGVFVAFIGYLMLSDSKIRI